MNILDPDHSYRLNPLDCKHTRHYVNLNFVKREGPNFPGNVGAHCGTTLQEVLRACCDRLRYVNNQIRSHYNDDALELLRKAIQLLEQRAAERHNRSTAINLDEAEFGRCCPKCNHVGCEGGCH